MTAATLVMVMIFAGPSARIAPVAMIEPWPFMRRGTEATVPIPPGLVSEMLVPWKSSAVSLFSRVLLISSS